MTYYTLLTLLDECHLSSEQLGQRLGISGMTLRRWRSKPPEGDLPKIYQTALVDTVYHLIIEGKLSPEAPSVKAMLEQNTHLSIGAALTNLGLSSSGLGSDEAGARNDDRLVEALAAIGMNEERKRHIDDSVQALNYFQKLGRDWKTKVSLLRQVVTSAKMSALDKLVAYGALFYLLTPFDLVPDYIPVVGLVDDYGMLALAVSHYTSRFTKNLLPVVAPGTPEPARSRGGEVCH